MKPNKKFEFDIKDIDTIEMALRNKAAELSRRLNARGCNGENLRTELNEMSELLARIHHQKNWYRPNKAIYISG